MNVTGSRELDASPEAVWAALTDRAVLEAVVPGCERVEAGGPLRLVAGWGVVALDGRFDVRVDVDEAERPEAATLRVSAEGEPGGLAATVRARLRGSDDRTRVDWEADCAAEGRLATVGSRVLEAALRRTADALLDRVGAHVTAPAEKAVAGPFAADADAAATREWGPSHRGPGADGRRLVLAVLAGAAGALLGVWLVQRLRSRG